MLRLFLSFQLKKIARFFESKTLAKVITSSLFLAVLLFLASGIYFFFYASFRYIGFVIEEELRLPITFFIYENFLLIISFVVLFSSLIFGIFHLFRGKNDSWLISSPGFTSFPHFVFLQNIVSSAWPIFIIFLPGMLAFVSFFTLPLFGFFAIVIAVALFLITIVSISLTSIVALSFLYYSLSKKIPRLVFNFKGFVIFLFLSSSTFIYFLWGSLKNIDLVALFKAEDVSQVISLGEIGSYFRLLPSHPFAELLLGLQTKTDGMVASSLFALSVYSLFSFLIWYKVSKLYYPVWQRFQEGGTTSQSSQNPFARKTFLFTGGQTLTLFKKEALVLGRNSKGLMWFSFLFLIWLAQIGSHVILERNIQKNTPDLTTSLVLLESFEFLIAVYFICAFTLRFVFPAFSMEKKLLWLLGSAPINFNRIFGSKLVFYIILFSSVGFLMNFISASVLAVPIDHAITTTVLFISTILLIVTLGLSLGAIFPSHETDDPEIISTSMPGLFFTLLSLIYGSISTYVLYQSLLTKTNDLVIAFSLLTLLICGILIFLTPKFARKYLY
jgi:hypothetical protein